MGPVGQKSLATNSRMAGLSPWAWSGIFLLSLTAVLAIWFLWEQRAPTPLTGPAARAAIKSGSVSVVVDVRGDAEWADGHYPNARHIPLQSLIQELPRAVADRSIGVMFYCRTGRRAAAAARLAQELGYRDTYYLTDADWKALMPRHRFVNA
jgi:rhodanese-related sulfurtransferase